MLMLSACRQSASRSDPDNRLPSPDAIGRRSDVSQVRWVEGKELGRLARAHGGHGTLFNVWATWCGSCKGEFPTMQQIATQFGPRGIQVVPVSVDEPEQMTQLVNWIGGRGFAPPAWLAARPLDRFKAEVAPNWLGNIPITLLYDAHGKRRFFWNGPIRATEVTSVLEDFLAGKPIDGERHYSLSAGATEVAPPIGTQ